MSAARVPYLIVGGGMAADAGARGIRAVDPAGAILMLAAEPFPPYDRPPLSKELWAGMDEALLDRATAAEDVEIRTATPVVELRPREREVVLAGGSTVRFERLLLATGASPRALPGGGPSLIRFRTIEDYRVLRHAAGTGARIGLIGAGLIGTELAASLSTAGATPILVDPEPAPLVSSLPAPLRVRAARLLAVGGVELRMRAAAVGAAGPDGKSTKGWITLADGGQITDLDAVVVGLGVRPEIGLAADAGLEVANGVVVDAALRTSVPSIRAAGDVIAFRSSDPEGLVRIEHEEHANESGMLAGMGLAGEDGSYDPVPHFYSQLGDVTWEVIGFPAWDQPGATVSAHLDERPDAPGVVLVRTTGRLTTIVLWNHPGQASRARRLIRSGSSVDDGEALARLRF